MENKKNNIFIGILVGIIVMLLIFIGLLFTGIIILNTNDSTKKDSNIVSDNDTNTEEDSKSNIFEITYKEESYSTKNSSGTVISTSTRNIPVIVNESNQQAADKIVSTLTEISDKEWNNNIKKTADEVAANDVPYTNLGVTYLFSNGTTRQNSITFMLELNGDFGGTGWLEKSGYNFNTETGDLLTLESISNDYTSLKNKLFEESKNYITNDKYLSCLVEDWTDTLPSLFNVSGNWFFNETGITISLPKYSVACGADGIIQIDISSEKINDYLLEDYKF
jgi:hypothetical protein